VDGGQLGPYCADTLRRPHTAPFDLATQTRKRYEPAIIPTRHIIRARELQSGVRHGLMIQLKTGHQIGMFIGGDPNHDLIKRLRNALLPQNRTKPNFKIELDLDSIQKMIDYFSDETPGA